MREVVSTFVGCEFAEDFADPVADSVPGPFAGFSEQGLELGEGHLDGVQIGRVGRQVKQPGAAVLDGFAHAWDLVAGEVVGDHDVAFSECRRENLADINEEGLAVHRPIQYPGCDDPVMAQAADKGGGLPMTPRDFADQSLPARTTAMRAGHLGVGTGFIQEDQLCRIKPALAALPGRSRRGDVRPILLGGVQGFF